MNKISCNVIKDLLPLYADEAVSEDTKALVEEHTGQCSQCRKELEQIKGNMIIPLSREQKMKEADFLVKVQNTIKKKNVRIGLTAALATIICVVGIYSLMVFPTKVIPYEEGLIKITEENDKVYAQFAGDNYDCVYMRTELTEETEGKERQISVIYYDQSLYSRFIDPIIRPDKKFDNHCINDTYWTTDDNGKEREINPELEALYYSPVKIDKRSVDYKITDHLDELELIWEKE